ncbi:TadE family protein [Microbacterium panaciterrae]|uniref:TadE family protein n=1 Tax=Microbacterium panaciterrae TaxID=985759 RepID=A0ABP8PSI9_9MICO
MVVEDPDGREAGSAALEFIALGVILLVPLVYLVLALGTIQGQVLGVESAARHAARTMSAAVDVADASARAEAAVQTAIAEYGMDPAAVDLDIRCAPAGAACPSAGATVVVTIRAGVALPLMPPVFGLDRIASVPVQASSAYKVSRTWVVG